MYQLYTLFYIKLKKFFLFFLNPGTIGTIVKKASNTNEIGGRAHDFLYLFITYTKRGIQILMRRPKKSKYKSVVIKKKRYYFYEITWIDPTGDSGHATAHDSLGLLPSTMITHAYLFDKNNKYVWTFGTYEKDDELFSDRNVFPRGCVLKMEKVTL